MYLPKPVAAQIEQWLARAELNQLHTAYLAVKEQYQKRNTIKTPTQHLAYIAARMPATFGVCRSVFGQLESQAGEIKSMLDLGAGPGTASLVALEAFPSLSKVTMVDNDPHFRTHALELLQPSAVSRDYLFENLTTFAPAQQSDLVVCSYVLNELSAENIQQVIDRAWQATSQFLVLIEPGTPLGFSIIKKARDQLLKAHAHLVAPCPHQAACPIAGQDWCHFSVRVQRTSLHRAIKQATLPYEDEKYSYLIAARHPHNAANNRIIKRPIRASGHLIFDLCTESGTKRITVSKKQKERYALGKMKRWGDSWDDSPC